MNTLDFPSFFDLVEFKNRLSALQATKFFILVDSNTMEHCLPQLDLLAIPDLQNAELIEVEPGEESKSIEVCAGVWRTLLEADADRKSVIVNLGGGMITDLGGYAAAAFKRGIRFVNIPTSLLAMVDAAIGGKVGVNLDHYKNQIGHFSPAETVWINPDFLNTLPQRELHSGKAEMYKHGLIADRKHWLELVNDDIVPKGESIGKSIEIKMSMVQSDPMERGKRKLLNYGHTIGHALEGWAHQNGVDIRHGEAVAAGILVESHLSKEILGLDRDQLIEIQQNMLSNYDFSPWREVIFDDVIPFLLKDKKNENEHVNFTLLHEIGTSSYDHFVALDLIKRSFEKTQSIWL